MKKRRKRAKARSYATISRVNRHHLLFQARYWDCGMAKELRNVFIYWLPVEIHNELHNHVLHNVPKPPSDALKTLYLAFLDERHMIYQLDILNALKWLEMHCPDDAFKQAMRVQREFLSHKPLK